MPPARPTEYEPKYISLDSVPIEIPNEYSIEDKREALFQAEAAIEADRTGGWEIEQDELTALHQSAVANLATYHLARGATNNSDVTLGDLDDGGDEKKNHADQFVKTYEKHMDRLASSNNKEGQTGTYFGATGGSGKTVTVNGGRDGRRHDLDHKALIHDQFL